MMLVDLHPNAFEEGIEVYRDTLRVGVNSLSMVPSKW